MENLFYKLRYRKKLSHMSYSLMFSRLNFQFRDSKYYYFKDVSTNEKYKILRIEDGERLDIIMSL